MFRSIGVPELLILLFLTVLVYGILMTIDSVRRPASQYRLGKKPFWIALLILANPLLARFAGGLVWLVSLFIFMAAAVIYHSQNRWHNPIQKVVPRNAA